MESKRIDHWKPRFIKNINTYISLILIGILVGIMFGGFCMRLYQKSQMDTAILLGGVVYNEKIYDINERVK